MMGWPPKKYRRTCSQCGQRMTPVMRDSDYRDMDEPDPVRFVCQFCDVIRLDCEKCDSHFAWRMHQACVACRHMHGRGERYVNLLGEVEVRT